MTATQPLAVEKVIKYAEKVKKIYLRSEDLIISASLTQDFCPSSRRRNRRIAGSPWSLCLNLTRSKRHGPVLPTLFFIHPKILS